MPLGKYKDFKACEEEHSKDYCGALYWKIHGKKEGTKKLKHEIEELRKMLNGK
jgi:hypothetical protein